MRPSHPSSTLRYMVQATAERTPSAEELLLAAYTQWVDLARDRWTDSTSTKDPTPRVRQYLWRDDDNPVNDPKRVTSPLLSESFLCFLLPTVDLAAYSLFEISPTGNQAQSAKDARSALRYLKLNQHGEPASPQDYDKPVDDQYIHVILDVIDEYYNLLKGEGGAAASLSFTAGNYLTPAEDCGVSLSELSIVDAYSLGLSVALRVLYLLDHISIDFDEKQQKLRDNIHNLAKAQLGESLRGLKDSFVVKEFAENDWTDSSESQYSWDELRQKTEIQSIRVKLQTLGYRVSPNKAFECGWTWGPRPSIRDDGELLPQNAPYLYFTSVALAAVDDLQDNSLQAEALMDDEHLRAVSELRTLADLTTRYWTILATQENDQGYPRALSVPWMTTDKDGSAYYTLYLLGIVFSTSGTDVDVEWAIDVLEELAQRGRITTRHLLETRLIDDPNSKSDQEPTEETPEAMVDTSDTMEDAPETVETPEAIVQELHRPGKILKLIAAPADSTNPKREQWVANWRIYDYSPLLLKIASQILYRTTNHVAREKVSRLIASILRHLETRLSESIDLETLEMKISNSDQKITDIRYGMWDDFQEFARARDVDSDTRTWYFTQRVVEALTLSIRLRPPPLDSPATMTLLRELLTEIERSGITVEPIRVLARQSPSQALVDALKTLRINDN